MDTDAVLDLVREVVAEHVTPRFGALERDDVSSKRRPGDLVTVADREAEAALSAALGADTIGDCGVGVMEHARANST